MQKTEIVVWISESNAAVDGAVTRTIEVSCRRYLQSWSVPFGRFLALITHLEDVPLRIPKLYLLPQAF